MSFIQTPSSVNTAGGASVVAMSGNVTLTSASNKVQVLTPDVSGRQIVLPDATAMATGGALFVLSNTVSDWPIAIMDSTGVNVGWVVADYASNVYLNSNATAAGVWSVKTGNASADAGVYLFGNELFDKRAVYNDIRPVTMALSASLSVNAGMSSNTALTVSGFDTRLDGSRVSTGATLASVAGAIGGQSCACPLNATTSLHVYYDVSGQALYCQAVTYSSDGTASIGAAVLIEGVTSSTPSPCVSRISDTSAITCYKFNAGDALHAVVISVSGNVCTVNTVLTSGLGSYASREPKIAALSATVAHVAASSLYSIAISGASLSVAGSVALPVALSGFSITRGIVKMSSTTSAYLLNSSGGTTGSLVGYVVTDTGGAPSIGSVSASLGAAVYGFMVTPIKDGLALMSTVTSNDAVLCDGLLILLGVAGGVVVKRSTAVSPVTRQNDAPCSVYVNAGAALIPRFVFSDAGGMTANTQKAVIAGSI